VSRFRVVICGGGIVAVEALLRIRALAGEKVDVTMIAPGEELRYRPTAVDQPFTVDHLPAYPLDTIASHTGARWVQDAAKLIDPDDHVVHTAGGQKLRFDALLLAIGARSVRPFEHVTVFDEDRADEAYHGLVQDVEEGYTRSVALLVPEGPTRLLPAYELALMTAERAESVGQEGVAVFVVTPEPAPLAALGEGASSAVAELLDRAKVRVYTGARAVVPGSRHLLVTPNGPDLEPERIVTLPRIEGRPLAGVPTVDGGFVPVDELARVQGIAGQVFAAGDGTNLPFKHGSVGAQQADVAAAGIAALAGAAIEPEPLRPVVWAMLHTGREPLYLKACLEGDRVVSEVRSLRDWPGNGKVVADELSPFLHSLESRLTAR
jgi:sulfide:quinone oxidoreductase